MCDEGKVTVNEAEREEIYKKAQKIVLNDSPNIFMASPMEYFFLRTNIEGFEPSTFNAENFENIVIK